jgi:hypothetical protein
MTTIVVNVDIRTDNNFHNFVALKKNSKHPMNENDSSSHSLKDSNASPKVKTMEEEKIGYVS